MKQPIQFGLAVAVTALLAGSVLTANLYAAEGKNSTKEFMKKYHKAPKGTDPVCKKASDGQATPEEIKALVAGYKAMCDAKPPRGDESSWKEKTSKLLTAAQELEKGAPDAAAHYKAAVNCKACHSAHKGE